MSSEAQIEALAKEIWAARRQRVIEVAGDDIGRWEAENEFLHENVKREARAAIAFLLEPMPKCQSWLGHKFEARYSTANNALTKLIEQADKIDITATTVRAMRDEEYHHDICVRCGFVVNRQTPKD